MGVKSGVPYCRNRWLACFLLHSALWSCMRGEPALGQTTGSVKTEALQFALRNHLSIQR